MGSQSLPTIRLATPSGSVVCERCEVALTTLAKLRRSFDHHTGGGPGGGLLKKPASWTHTLFSTDPIDVVFLDTDLRVVKLVTHLAPWRFALCRRASAVVTLQAGQAARHEIRLGVRLVSNPSAGA